MSAIAGGMSVVLRDKRALNEQAIRRYVAARQAVDSLAPEDESGRAAAWVEVRASLDAVHARRQILRARRALAGAR